MSKNIGTCALVLMIMIFGTGCSTEPSTNNVVEFESFQKEYQLTSELEEWLDIWQCTDLRIYDKILVAIDWKRERVFHVYNIESKKLIGSFGRVGKGPNEYFDAPYLKPVFSYEGNDLIIQIYDRGRETLQNINVSKSIEKGHVVEKSKYKFPDGYSVYLTFMTNDSTVYNADSSFLQIYNPLNGEVRNTHDPIQLAQNLPANYDRNARIMYPEKTPHSDTIISSFYYMKRMHVYNMKGDLLRVIKERGKHIFDTSEERIWTKNKMHFTKTFLSEKYILVLNQNRISGTATNGELLLFDYEGNALCKYELDCWISLGDVDWEAKRFYTNDYIEGTMISFSLPGIDE